MDVAQSLLCRLAGPDAVLRPEQRAAIEAAVAGRRALVVQRTGFGKSAIYFIACRLLRDAGAGPTLVVSPLLALMRDQVAAAERMGVRSATVNSTNVEEWSAIEASLRDGSVDLLCISPERLNNHRFVREVLPSLSGSLGMLVIDEAHCISDWGHDFRPDYRRIGDALARLAPGTPVLATTATANGRVCDDVAEQLGADVLVLRGSLDRESLRLGVAGHLGSAADRLAWVAQRLRVLEGTGIVYCLTVAQTVEVASFLQSQGLDVVAYSSDTPAEERSALEAAFKANEVKALVATSALGMGVDKPDVRFVVHLGAPPSPIAYYQQVGRAGRSVPDAEAWLLPGGDEDRRIWEWFSSVGLPPEALVRRVLDALGSSPQSIPSLERSVDLKRARLEALLKILDVDGAVERVDGGWIATGRPWAYDDERVARIRATRAAEAEAMVDYGAARSCLFEQLRRALDDPEAAPCGRCQVCTGAPDPVALDPEVVRAAVEHLRGADVVVEPRKQWPRGLDAPRGNIPVDRRASEGRALCRDGDAGWWPSVAPVLAGEPVDDELRRGMAACLKRWPWPARPTWITWVPSQSAVREALLADVAARLGALGKLEVRPALRRTRPGPPQASVANSAHRCRNVWGAFAVATPVAPGPVLLLDDAVDTGWTMTVAASLLREAGATAVLPFALVKR